MAKPGEKPAEQAAPKQSAQEKQVASVKAEVVRSTEVQSLIQTNSAPTAAPDAQEIAKQQAAERLEAAKKLEEGKLKIAAETRKTLENMQEAIKANIVSRVLDKPDFRKVVEKLYDGEKDKNNFAVLKFDSNTLGGHSIDIKNGIFKNDEIIPSGAISLLMGEEPKDKYEEKDGERTGEKTKAYKEYIAKGEALVKSLNEQIAKKIENVRAKGPEKAAQSPEERVSAIKKGLVDQVMNNKDFRATAEKIIKENKNDGNVLKFDSNLLGGHSIDLGGKEIIPSGAIFLLMGEEPKDKYEEKDGERTGEKSKEYKAYIARGEAIVKDLNAEIKGKLTNPEATVASAPASTAPATVPAEKGDGKKLVVPIDSPDGKKALKGAEGEVKKAKTTEELQKTYDKVLGMFGKGQAGDLWKAFLSLFGITEAGKAFIEGKDRVKNALTDGALLSNEGSAAILADFNKNGNTPDEINKLKAEKEKLAKDCVDMVRFANPDCTFAFKKEIGVVATNVLTKVEKTVIDVKFTTAIASAYGDKYAKDPTKIKFDEFVKEEIKSTIKDAPAAVPAAGPTQPKVETTVPAAVPEQVAKAETAKKMFEFKGHRIAEGTELKVTRRNVHFREVGDDAFYETGTKLKKGDKVKIVAGDSETMKDGKNEHNMIPVEINGKKGFVAEKYLAEIGTAGGSEHVKKASKKEKTGKTHTASSKK